jgi:repressor LexA
LLTERQLTLLRIIEKRLAETGVAPSYAEMRDALGRKSTGPVTSLVKALEERGFIRRLKRRARAIEIIRPSDGGLGG